MLYLILGAALTIVSSATVQLTVVPRVESKKRRDARWEENVLLLGELFTDSIAKTATKARSDIGFSLLLGETELDDPKEQERLDELRQRTLHEARSSTREYTDLSARANWLLDLVVSYAPTSPSLMSLAGLQTKFRLAQLDVDSWEYADNYTTQKCDESWNREREVRIKLVSNLKSLARLAHPPRPSYRRLTKQRLKRFTSRLERHPSRGSGPVR